MSHTIASSIELQLSLEGGKRIVIRKPGHSTSEQLVTDLPHPLANDVLEAVRLAYHQGRLDSRQEVSTVIRGVLGL